MVYEDGRKPEEREGEKERRREGGKERDKLGIEAEGNRSMTFHRAAATR